ncbi:MAG: hypothetical protein ACJARF_002349, partial [Alteromonadaceae bacterium]
RPFLLAENKNVQANVQLRMSPANCFAKHADDISLCHHTVTIC